MATDEEAAIAKRCRHRRNPLSLFRIWIELGSELYVRSCIAAAAIYGKLLPEFGGISPILSGDP